MCVRTSPTAPLVTTDPPPHPPTVLCRQGGRAAGWKVKSGMWAVCVTWEGEWWALAKREWGREKERTIVRGGEGRCFREVVFSPNNIRSRRGTLRFLPFFIGVLSEAQIYSVFRESSVSCCWASLVAGSRGGSVQRRVLSCAATASKSSITSRCSFSSKSCCSS